MSGEKITARLRTERDLSNGKERIQVYEVDAIWGLFMEIENLPASVFMSRSIMEITMMSALKRKGRISPIYIPMDASMMMGTPAV